MLGGGLVPGQVVLVAGDGMLVQELPFSVSLKRFVIEHYSTGQPRLFASDVIVTVDPASSAGNAVPSRAACAKGVPAVGYGTDAAKYGAACAITFPSRCTGSFIGADSICAPAVLGGTINACCKYDINGSGSLRARASSSGSVETPSALLTVTKAT